MFSHKEKGIAQHRVNRIHLTEFYEQDGSIVQYLLQNKSSLAHHSAKRNINDP
jgi:hypothetical protein